MMSNQLSRSIDTKSSAIGVSWTADQYLACIIAFALPIRAPITGWLTYGLVISILILPIVTRSITKSRWGFTFLVLAAFALLSGWLTREFEEHGSPSLSTSGQLSVYHVGLIISLTFSVVVAVWICQRVGIRAFLLAWSVGLIVHQSAIGVFTSENPWKYGLALPVSLILTILATRTGKTHLVAAFIVLAGISIAFSYRSWLAIIAISFGYVIVLYRIGRNHERVTSRSNPILVGAVFSAAMYGIYLILIQLMTSGVLGEYVKSRTLRQERMAGSALIGGRPEWGAAMGLARENPFGFGLGVTPTQVELSTAIRSLPIGNRRLQEVSNVANAFRNGEFSFHSTFWNFWANYGIGGAILIGFVIVTLSLLVFKIRDFNHGIGVMLPVVILFLGCIWDSLFSPSPIAVISAGLAVAIHLTQHRKFDNEGDGYKENSGKVMGK